MRFARTRTAKSRTSHPHPVAECEPVVSREYKSGRGEIAHLQPAIEIFWGNIYLRITRDGNAERRKRKEIKGMHVHASQEGAREVETTPLLDYRTSVAQHGHSLSSRRRPSGLIVSFPRASPSALIRGWATPTSESIYLRTFKAPPVCTQRLRKLAGN